MHLDGKVAIVTGGASLRGIGWATARRFAEEGARIKRVRKRGSPLCPTNACSVDQGRADCVEKRHSHRDVHQGDSTPKERTRRLTNTPDQRSSQAWTVAFERCFA